MRATLVFLMLSGCGLTPGHWVPANHARLDKLLRERGRESQTYSPARKPVAVFDWDNTMMRNDIGDATLAWMLRHDAVLAPPGGDWARSNRHLTSAAIKSLFNNCGQLTDGKPIPTSSKPACAEAILRVYEEGKTSDGEPTWDAETGRATHQPYAWAAQLLRGHTADEIRGFARQAYAEASAAPIGATQTIGKHTLDAWVRIYPEMRNLVGELQRAGFEVYIVSASAQPLAEVVAGEVGIDPSHVVGVRNIRRPDGHFDAALEPCGGLSGDEVMTYDEGKRCFINKVIFKRAVADQLPRATDPNQRPSFAAGDSDTDLAMVVDAVDLKLTIDRHRPKLMCHAHNNAGGRWLIQPMFIQPFAAADKPYSCVGLTDETGAAIPDQKP
jgi:phosphoserine phosphatase